MASIYKLVRAIVRQGVGSMGVEHFANLFGLGAAVWGVLNLIRGQPVQATGSRSSARGSVRRAPTGPLWASSG
jgi:hypothetical protein